MLAGDVKSRHQKQFSGLAIMSFKLMHQKPRFVFLSKNSSSLTQRGIVNADTKQFSSNSIDPYLISSLGMSRLRQPNSLSDLPTEIRLQIYQSCKRYEQKQLRQINRQLEGELTPILFKQMYMDAAGLDTEAFVQSTSILTAVKSLVISSNVLSCLSLQVFQRELWWYLDWQPEHWQQKKQWIKHSFKRYEAHRISQRLRLEKLASTLKSLQNLNTIKVIRLFDFQASAYWRRLEEEICAPKSISLERWTTGQVRGHGVVSALWPSRLSCKLIALDYYYVPLLCWDNLNDTSSWNTLKMLRLCVAMGNSVADCENTKLSLQRVLTATNLLESLYLAADPCPTYSSRFDFSDMLLNVSTLTRLQELTLMTITIEEEQLLQIFQKYSDSLERFTLSDIHLSKGLWHNITDVVQGSARTCRFELEGVTEGNGWHINTVVPFGESTRIEKDST